MLREVNIHDDVISTCLCGLAQVIKVEDHPERVAIFLGAAEAFRPKTVVFYSDTYHEFNSIRDAVHQYLDDVSFDTAFSKGLAMTKEEAIAFALAEETLE